MKEYTLLVCILFVISLSSCSDNPLTPEPPPPSAEIIDSNFFDWEYFDVPGINLLDPVYIIDTNDILMMGVPMSVRFRNRKIEYTNFEDPDFSPRALNGIGKTVYIGGKSLSQNNIKLKKLEGNTITEIQIPFDTTSQYIAYIYTYAENDIWLTTPHRYVYRYHNYELTKYFDNEDTRINNVVFDKSSSGQITAILRVNIGPPDYFYIYIYKKFENPHWEEIGRDTVNSSSSLKRICGFSADGKVFRQGGKGNIYVYNDNAQWIEYVNTLNVFEIGDGDPEIAIGNADAGVLIHGHSYHLEQPFPILYYINNQMYFQSNHRIQFNDRRISGVNYRLGRYSLVYRQSLFDAKFSIGIPKTKSNQNEKIHSNHGITLIE